MNSFFKKTANWAKEARFGLFITAFALIFIITIALVAGSQANNDDPVASVVTSSNSEISITDSTTSTTHTSSDIEDEEKVLLPFSVDVTIARYFFDPSDDLETRSQALITYDNKIIPSMGVDYVYDGKQFDVEASFTGKVVAKLNDNLYGLSVIIEHESGLKALYCGLTEVEVYQDEIINQGELIGKSGESIINAELGNHLHFALQYDEKYLNPLKSYDKEVQSLAN